MNVARLALPSSRLGRMGLIAALLLAGALLLAATRAEAGYILFKASDSQLGRANMDGTGVNVNVAGTMPSAISDIELTDTHMYFSRRATGVNGGIFRANLDGTNPTQLVFNVPNLETLAIDDQHIYYGTFTAAAASGGHPAHDADTIYRVDLGGQNRTPVAAGVIDPSGLAVNDTHVYWTSAGLGRLVGRARLDGGAEDSTVWIPISTGDATSGANPHGIAVNDTHIYWANYDSGNAGGSIGRATIGDVQAERVVERNFIPVGTAPNTGPRGVGLDSEHVYWGVYGTLGNTMQYGRANLDGTEVAHAFITAPGAQPFNPRPTAIAVDERRSSDTTLQCTPATIPADGSTTCTASVTDLGGGTLTTPTGTISFFAFNASGAADNGVLSAPSCTLTESALGLATCQVTFTPAAPGAKTLRASYSGSPTFAVGGPGVANITASPHPTSTEVACTPPNVILGQATSCRATVTDTSATPIAPTGSVSFSSTGPGSFSPTSCSLSPVSGQPNRSSCAVNHTATAPAGPRTITGNYGGATNFAASSGQTAFSALHTTISTLACAPTSLNAGQQTECTATVVDIAGAASAPGGSVSFLSGGPGPFDPASCTLASAGPDRAACSVRYTPTASGTPIVVAEYGGDPVHAASAAQRILTVGAELRPTNATIACEPSPLASGRPTTCTATVTDTSPSPGTPTGTAEFEATGAGAFAPTPSCALAPAGPGAASCAVDFTPSAQGAQAITVGYGGDSSHSGDTGQTAIEVGSTAGGSTTALECEPAPVRSTKPATCTVTVADSEAPGGTSPTGDVAFEATGGSGAFAPASSCTLSVAGPGTASCEVAYTPTGEGSRVIAADYPGDGFHHGSGDDVEMTVGPPPNATSASVTCVPGDVTVERATTCTVTIRDTGTGPVAPTGSVAFSSDADGTFDPAGCQLTAGAGDSSSCSVEFTPTEVTQHNVAVAYGGDGNHTGSNGTRLLQVGVATPHEAVATLACAPLFVPMTTPTTCTATVHDVVAVGGVPPEGPVTFTTEGGGAFSPDTCMLAPVDFVMSRCSVSYTPSAVGPQTLRVAYAGSPDHEGGDDGVATVIAQNSPGAAMSDQPPAGFEDPIRLPFTPTEPEPDPMTLGALSLNRKRGTATLKVRVPSAGRVVLRGEGVRRASKIAARRGVVELVVRAKGKAMRELRREGRARIRLRVTFTPLLGEAQTRSRAVTLRRAR